MFRRLLFVLALVVGSTTALTSCHEHCYIVFNNGPGNHPPGGAYIADIQTWYTVVGGQLNLYGYSRTIDTVIMNERDCVNNLADELPQLGPV
jgi:hypothetical protein